MKHRRKNQRLWSHEKPKLRFALDIAADLGGSVRSGLRDLSHNKKHLRGFGGSHQEAPHKKYCHVKRSETSRTVSVQK
jgi:hypothetical protein